MRASQKRKTISKPQILTLNYYVMKKIISMPLLAMCVVTMSCTSDLPEKQNGADGVSIEEAETVPITFACNGFEMDQRAMTRGELSADGNAMTDLWVLDYKDGALIQQLHQSSSDADFAEPTMNLAVGDHHVYFVASRGQSPTLNTEAHTISFSKVLDTFYKDYSVNISATSAGSHSVTLDRCVTRLKLQFLDAIPEGAATFHVTPHTWYFSLDYLTGNPAIATTDGTTTITIPASSIGKTDQYLNLFGFSSATEWTTDIAFDCKASDNSILGQATITDAPLKRNRITSFSGPLFSGQSAMALALSSDWLTSYEATW